MALKDIFKTTEGLDTGKIKKDIADLKSKKQALLLSLQNDIQTVERKISHKFYEIGQKVYNAKAEVESFEIFSGDFAEIDRLKAEQAEIEAKKADVSKRYDDEIAMFEKLIPGAIPAQAPVAQAPVAQTPVAQAPIAQVPVAPPPAPSVSASMFCTNCGKPYDPATDAFCLECGNKL